MGASGSKGFGCLDALLLVERLTTAHIRSDLSEAGASQMSVARAVAVSSDFRDTACLRQEMDLVSTPTGHHRRDVPDPLFANASQNHLWTLAWCRTMFVL